MISLFTFIVLATVLAIIAIAAFVVLGGVRRRGHIERALNMTLLHIRVPRETPGKDDTLQKMRELISVSEHMLTSFSTIHAKGWNKFVYGEPYISLEIAVQNSREDTFIYIAVPKSLRDTIEKQIYSSYPTAEITQSKDYNIFHQNGVIAGAYVTYAKNPILPLKTYQKLESDPLSAIFTAMSKLKIEGEGAALQILLRPSHNDGAKSFAIKVAREMQSGHQFEQAHQRALHPPKPKESDPNKPAEPEPPRVVTPAEEEIIKAITTKAGKQAFDVNIRFLASAPEQFEADQILDELLGSISQFSSQDLNNLNANKLKGKDLEKLAYNFAFRLFDSHQTLTMSVEEITSIYHLPIATTATPKVSLLKAKPSEPPANLPQEGIIIGTSRFRGEDRSIRLTDEDRRRHLYIIGQTGTGKSTLMKNMIKQDIAQGHGIGILDPAGEFAEFALSLVPKERADDVVYFDPNDLERPIGLNMFEINPDNPEEKTKVINELFGIMDRLYNLKETGGPVFEKYFRNACLLLLDDYRHEIPTLADISRVLTDDAYRADKLSRETNPLVVQFWKQEAEKAGGEAALANMAPYISTKVDVFVSNEFLRPILNQTTTAFNFRDVMDGQKILICNLSKGKIGELNAKLLGSLIVGKLAVAAFSRETITESERKDFYLYMDEFQNFTTDSVKIILSEARKYRLELILAHQYIKQLPEDIRDAVFGNVGSMIALRVGADDAEYLKNKFEPVFTPADLTNIDNLNAYVSMIINGQTTRPFNIAIDFTDAGPQEMVTALKELSRLKYGRSREEVEAEIKARFAKYLQP